MSEKEQIIKEKADHSGIFDFKGLYSYANSWFRDEGYGVTEEKYSEKVSGNTRDINIEWKAIKRLSDYFKVEIGVKFEVKELAEVEVEIDGKKKKTNKGKINIEVKGSLVKDPDSKWDSSPTYRFMRDVYNKYVVPKRVEDTEDKITSDVKTFKDQIKSYLELLGRE